MCRLVLMNKEGEKLIEKRYGLAKYFKYLEEQLGGHGNGYALMKKGKIIKLDKGINLDVRDIANVLIKTDYDWAIFHTRLASVGEKVDRNCHPFKKENTVLAMNGTECSVSFLSVVREITDTEAILETIIKYHLGITALKKLNSIFVGFHNSNPFIVANNTFNIKLLKLKSAIVFASNFPSKLKNIYYPRETFIWNGNEQLPKVFKRYKNKIHRYTRVVPFDYDIESSSGQYYIKSLNSNSRGGIDNEIAV